MSILAGKIALVTGASRGIGRSIAIKIANEGGTVVINYSKDVKGAEETLKIIKELGGYGKLIQGNISIYTDCAKIIQETIDTFGKIDILVNNAGISQVGLFMDSTKEEIDNIIDVNLRGMMYITRIALPEMINRGTGKIINISSMWGEVGASCEVSYSSTKGGVNLFTKALAKEVAPMGIKVNAVAPGVINTEMNSFLSKDELDELVDDIPEGRLGEPEEVAEIVVFLGSDKCNYLTGQVIRVDGGII